jgi:2-keto-4-pentenoate hydratase/2-oxohepta-3-ene-1,7-dioic acid hydratase in catechol pathway
VKLLAYDRGDGVRHGYLTDAGIVDLGPGDVMAVIRNGIETADGPIVEMDGVRLLAPVGEPGKIVCIGLNYHDHCREQHIDPPAYPRLFGKFANAVNRPGGTVRRPAMTEQLDQECELAVVIGQRASGIGPKEAMEHVFGYTILNDITMRELQREDKQWLRAKGSDGFAPMGPVLVTADEIRDPQALRMRSFVNDEPWQDSHSAEMVFDVPTLIAFVSRTIALEPGDVLSTGTPAGVGHYQRPPRYLQDGDRLRCEIEGIGVLENVVADELPRVHDHAAAAGMGVVGARGSVA